MAVLIIQMSETASIGTQLIKLLKYWLVNHLMIVQNPFEANIKRRGGEVDVQ